MAVDCYGSVVHIPIVYVSRFGVVLACKCRPLVEQVPHLAAGCCGGLKCQGYTTTWDAILAITVARILGTDFDQAWEHDFSPGTVEFGFV